MVLKEMEVRHPGYGYEIFVIKTCGDELADLPLDAIGGKGVFVKDIEEQLLSSKIDFAVHSLKDMQANLADGLTIGACLERGSHRDMIFTQHNESLESLPRGSTVGTSSMRRRCQIRAFRPDLAVVDIRGNVPTRLNKVGAEVDAVILAEAGVNRLGLPPGIAIDPSLMIPSPGQGIIAVECRNDDRELVELGTSLDHPPTHLCAEAERAFLRTLGLDCRLPAGAYAHLQEGLIIIEGMLATSDEKTVEKLVLKGDTPEVGSLLAEKLKEQVRRAGEV